MENKDCKKQDSTQAVAENRPMKFQIELYDEDTNENGDVIGYKKVHTDDPLIITAACKKDLDDYAAKIRYCHQKMKIVKVLDQGNADQGNADQRIIASKNEAQIIQSNSCTSTRAMNKPKYFKIGDIEVKDDNGKIYQKQWMRLTDSEASNIRIVNDKNNAAVNLNGKHIEFKKWVLVEDSSEEDAASSLENQLNEKS